MSFPKNEDEQMCFNHAKDLRRKANEWELKGLRMWQKRLGQHTKRLEKENCTRINHCNHCKEREDWCYEDAVQFGRMGRERI